MRKYVLPLLGLLIVATLSGCGVAVVEDGQTGVRANFGKIQDQPLATGWHVYLPLFSWIEI